MTLKWNWFFSLSVIGMVLYAIGEVFFDATMTHSFISGWACYILGYTQNIWEQIVEIKKKGKE